MGDVNDLDVHHGLGTLDDVMGVAHREEIVEEEYGVDPDDLVDIDDMDGTFVTYDDGGVHVGDEMDPYGGMPHHLYQGIVDFKKNGIYPNSIVDKRVDRSAHCHWRLRCQRFSLDSDQETLLYFNPSATETAKYKYVVKKGEVKEVIERVHKLIGHLGTKRTQMAINTKLYWRSVKNDVKTFIENCAFCNDKKFQGKKLLKAPVDISADDFDLLVTPISYESDDRSERQLQIQLSSGLVQRGFDEAYVAKASTERMTTYTFPSTQSPGGNQAIMERRMALKHRQPYYRKFKEEDPKMETSYLLPVMSHNGRGRVPDYLPLTASRAEAVIRMTDADMKVHKGYDGSLNPDDMFEHGELVVDMDEDEGIEGEDGEGREEGGGDQHPSTSNGGTLGVRRKHPSNLGLSSNEHGEGEAGGRDKKRKLSTEKRADHAVTGAAARLQAVVSSESAREMMMGQSSSQRGVSRRGRGGRGRGLGGLDRDARLVDTSNIVTSYDDAAERPEMSLLSPVLLIPSIDPEVIAMQKELLTRQLDVQKMQMRVLEAQYAQYELIQGGGVARYEDVHDEDVGAEEGLRVHEDELRGEGMQTSDLNVIDGELAERLVD